MTFDQLLILINFIVILKPSPAQKTRLVFLVGWFFVLQEE